MNRLRLFVFFSTMVLIRAEAQEGKLLTRLQMLEEKICTADFQIRTVEETLAGLDAASLTKQSGTLKERLKEFQSELAAAQKAYSRETNKKFLRTGCPK